MPKTAPAPPISEVDMVGNDTDPTAPPVVSAGEITSASGEIRSTKTASGEITRAPRDSNAPVKPLEDGKVTSTTTGVTSGVIKLPARAAVPRAKTEPPKKRADSIVIDTSLVDDAAETAPLKRVKVPPAAVQMRPASQPAPQPVVEAPRSR